MSAPAARAAKQSPLIDDMLMLGLVAGYNALALMVACAIGLWQIEHGLDN